MLKRLLILSLLAPSVAFAAGGSDGPPRKSKTTTECYNGKIYDKRANKCVNAKESSLSDDQLYEAAREFAYAEQYDNARYVLAAMSNQTDGRVQTYLGFTERKLGNFDQAMVHYTAAITQDPNNVLARSYMAQGLVENGDVPSAKYQLEEIRARGGAGTWAEVSLAKTLKTGKGYSY